VSIFLRRPGCERLIDALSGSDRAGIGAPTLAEAGVELGLATGRDLHGLLARFVQEFDLTVIPFSDAHSRTAEEAFRRFGQGGPEPEGQLAPAPILAAVSPTPPPLAR
jgi:uncharacterized protein with PIN domain